MRRAACSRRQVRDAVCTRVFTLGLLHSVGHAQPAADATSGKELYLECMAPAGGGFDAAPHLDPGLHGTRQRRTS
ncbi:hypothetical protein NKDENANG_02694 [Candidatus Entotheonellaceae bacterium PAL068K]